MRNFSNRYIFVFSAVMVAVVAAILATIAMQLKPKQQRNIKIEQMQSILKAVNIESTTGDAESKFSQYIVESYVVNSVGEKIDGVTVFDVNMKEETDKIQEIKTLNEKTIESKPSPFKKLISGSSSNKVDNSEIKKEIKTMEGKRNLPVYECKIDTNQYYIFPLRGKGLWGPIWGYVALESDFNTIYGANFDHKGETPGLGAEIQEDWFCEQLEGKQIFDNGKFVAIDVISEDYFVGNFVAIQGLKGKGTSKGNPNAIDAISGGTITSKGLEAMIFDCLNSYQEFFNIKKSVQ